MLLTLLGLSPTLSTILPTLLAQLQTWIKARREVFGKAEPFRILTVDLIWSVAGYLPYPLLLLSLATPRARSAPETWIPQSNLLVTTYSRPQFPLAARMLPHAAGSGRQVSLHPW